MIAPLWSIKIKLDAISKMLDEANKDYDSNDSTTMDDVSSAESSPHVIKEKKDKKKADTSWFSFMFPQAFRSNNCKIASQICIKNTTVPW